MTTVIRVRRTGAPEVLVPETDNITAPGAGQVRLRHHAIGVNFVDTMFRAGVYPMPLPFVGGVEGAGEIVETGPGVTDFAIGDRAAYFFAPGAYAEERLIDTAPLVRLPNDVPSDVAAGCSLRALRHGSRCATSVPSRRAMSCSCRAPPAASVRWSRAGPSRSARR